MRETARRKAREEVGIDCHIGPIIHTAETIFPDGPGGIPVHSINSCFLVYPVEELSREDVIVPAGFTDAVQPRVG